MNSTVYLLCIFWVKTGKNETLKKLEKHEKTA